MYSTNAGSLVPITNIQQCHSSKLLTADKLGYQRSPFTVQKTRCAFAITVIMVPHSIICGKNVAQIITLCDLLPRYVFKKCILGLWRKKNKKTNVWIDLHVCNSPGKWEGKKIGCNSVLFDPLRQLETAQQMYLTPWDLVAPRKSKW